MKLKQHEDSGTQMLTGLRRPTPVVRLRIHYRAADTNDPGGPDGPSYERKWPDYY